MTITKRFLVGVAMIFIAPHAHLWFGQDLSDAGIDGPEAFGVVLTMFWVGGVLATLYWGATLLGRLFTSSARTLIWYDALLGIAGAGPAFWAGVTAKYAAAVSG
jgi:hypothetical protein